MPAVHDCQVNNTFTPRLFCMNQRTPFFLVLFFLVQLSNAVFGAVLTPVTVNSFSPGFQGIYVGANALDQGLGEFLSSQGPRCFYLSVPAASETM